MWTLYGGALLILLCVELGAGWTSYRYFTTWMLTSHILLMILQNRWLLYPSLQWSFFVFVVSTYIFIYGSGLWSDSVTIYTGNYFLHSVPPIVNVLFAYRKRFQFTWSERAWLLTVPGITGPLIYNVLVDYHEVYETTASCPTIVLLAGLSFTASLLFLNSLNASPKTSVS